MEFWKVSLLFFISGLLIIVDAHPFSSLMKIDGFFDDAYDDNGPSPREKFSSEGIGELRRLGKLYR